MMKFGARQHGLVTEELEDGLVVFDQHSNQAHWLNATAAAVFAAGAGYRSVGEIAAQTGLDEAATEAALENLVGLGLVQSAGGVSRRTVLRTAVRVGAAGAVAAPIVSAIIPVAAAHASTGPTGGGGTPTGGNEPPGVFYIPQGHTVTFSVYSLSGCDGLSIGYALGGDTGTYQELLSIGKGNWPVCNSGSGGPTTIGPFATDQTFVVILKVTSSIAQGGGSYTFYSDGPYPTAAENHATVDTVGSTTTVYFRDDGGGACGPGCTTGGTPGPTNNNGQVTFTIN